MLRPSIPVIFLVPTLVVSAAALPAAELTAEALVQRAIDARGGSDKFSSVQSIRMKGTLDGGSIVVSAKRPSLFRVEITTPGGPLALGYNGTGGWVQPPGEQLTELTGAELDNVRSQAANAIGGPLLDAKARENKIDLEEREQKDGVNCYKLRIKLPGGRVIHEYLDPESYLTVFERLEDAGKPAIEETIGDYKRFGGILFPCRFVSGPAGGSEKQVLAVENMEINPELDGKIFAMPGSADGKKTKADK